MNSYAQRKQEQQSRAVANTYSRSGPHSSAQSNLPPGPHAALQASVNLRPQVRHVTQLQQMLNMSRRAEAPVQLKEAQPIQRNGWPDWVTRSYRLAFAMPRLTPLPSGNPWLMSSAVHRLNTPSAQNAPPQPQPSRVEVVPMRNRRDQNYLSGLLLALDLDDPRATAVAQQRLEAHRREPGLQNVFHVHSNASQATLHALTHRVLARVQAKEKGMTEREALADEQFTKEREEIFENTRVVSMAGPQSPTDIPLTNLHTLVNRQDIVPQLPTVTSWYGRQAVSNPQTFGPSAPPFPDVSELADMDPEQIGADFLRRVGTGLEAHDYQKNYRERGTSTTRQVVENLRRSGRPVLVHVGEGWGGTEEGTQKRVRELYEDILGKKPQ